jgi:hypothetical protein
MNTDKHFMWYLAGAEYAAGDIDKWRGTYARGNGWVDKWAYYEGNGSSYLYVECRILDTEVHTFGYTY